jgi:hypothetical protein
LFWKVAFELVKQYKIFRGTAFYNKKQEVAIVTLRKLEFITSVSFCSPFRRLNI